MDLIEAIQTRHSVRKYTDQPIEVAKLATLRNAIDEVNAQSGLNTCWAGLTYKKIPGTFSLRDGDIVHCMISLGYGANQGVQHPQKKSASNFFEPYGYTQIDLGIVKYHFEIGA